MRYCGYNKLSDSDGGLIWRSCSESIPHKKNKLELKASGFDLYFLVIVLCVFSETEINTIQIPYISQKKKKKVCNLVHIELDSVLSASSVNHETSLIHSYYSEALQLFFSECVCIFSKGTRFKRTLLSSILLYPSFSALNYPFPPGSPWCISREIEYYKTKWINIYPSIAV